MRVTWVGWQLHCQGEAADILFILQMSRLEMLTGHWYIRLSSLCITNLGSRGVGGLWRGAGGGPFEYDEDTRICASGAPACGPLSLLKV